MDEFIIKDITELTVSDISLHIGTAVPQKWNNGSVWDGYSKATRQNCGMVYIAGDFRMNFIAESGEHIIAGKGDLIYAPRGIKYTVYIEGIKNDIGRSYVINFSIKHLCGSEIHFSDGIKKLFNAKTPFLETEIKELCMLKCDISPRSLKLGSVFLNILDYIANEIKNSSKEYYPIRAGIKGLTDDWQKNERIGKYAKMCSMSESYFYLLFKNAVGMTPVEYRNKIRISNAKAMLRNSSSTVAEISATVGFEDSLFFSRLFNVY